MPGAFLCAGICAALSPSPAAANFQVCNQTLDVINVAIGAYDVDDWETRGWWIVGPNQCANVIEEELTSRYIYVYARDVFNKSMLDGTTSMCIKPEEFRLRGRQDCLLKGNLSADFFEVDTRRSERWTFYLQAPLD
ncbi:MAG: DUF1036 domain-containing protein [Pseudomonadota bacterium]